MTIIITISKGAVQSLTGLAAGQVVKIHDYDVLEVDAPDIRCDDDGDCYQEMRFEGEEAACLADDNKRERVCTECGSTDIRRDAWAIWNEHTQQWELDRWFELVFCKNCDAITDVRNASSDEV